MSEADLLRAAMREQQQRAIVAEKRCDTLRDRLTFTDSALTQARRDLETSHRAGKANRDRLKRVEEAAKNLDLWFKGTGGNSNIIAAYNLMCDALRPTPQAGGKEPKCGVNLLFGKPAPKREERG